MAINVIIADSQNLFRKAIIALLQNCADINVQGEAANVKKISDLMQAKHIDVLLIDYHMARIDSYDILYEIAAKYPAAKMIIMSIHDEEENIIKSIDHGAHGFVSKNAQVDQVFEAIQTVSSGGFFFNHLSLTATTDLNVNLKNC